MPKLFKKRPGMPPRYATGRKTAMSDSVVAHGVDRRAWRKRLLEIAEARAHLVHDLHRVRPGLFADCEHDGTRAVEDRGALALLRAVLDVPDVVHADRVPRLLANDELA